MSFQRVARIRWPSASSRFSRAPGSRAAERGDELADPLGTELEQVRREQGGVAHRLGRRMRAEHGAVDDAVVRQQPPARTGTARRRSRPAASRPRPSAPRRARSVEEITGATDANDASLHSGRFERQRAGSGPGRRIEPDAPAVGVHPAVALPARGVGLHEQAVRGLAGAAHRASAARPSQARWRHTQASQASRTPVKICRLIGWSQLRNEGRIVDGATAHEPPRSTL